MTVTYGFYNSVAGDRVYDALQLSKFLEGIITDGVMYEFGNEFAVTQATGMNVYVGSGKAWFNNTWTENDGNITLAITAAHPTLNRIDSVVFEIDTSSGVRTNTIKMVDGTAAGSPVAPTLTNTSTKFYYRIANVYVGAAVTSILTANITNLVGSTLAYCQSATFETDMLQDQIDTIAGDLNTLESTVATEQGYIDTLQSTMVTEQGNIDTLQSTMVTEQGNIDTLQSTMVTEQGYIDTLQSDVSGINTNLSNAKYDKRIIEIVCVTNEDALTVADMKGSFYFIVPSDLNGWKLVDADAAVTTVSSSGLPTFQIYNATRAIDLLSTKITIDANEYTSFTAATAPVIITTGSPGYNVVSTADILRFDCDVAGTGTKGMIMILVFQKP